MSAKWKTTILIALYESEALRLHGKSVVCHCCLPYLTNHTHSSRSLARSLHRTGMTMSTGKLYMLYFYSQIYPLMVTSHTIQFDITVIPLSSLHWNSFRFLDLFPDIEKNGLRFFSVPVILSFRSITYAYFPIFLWFYCLLVVSLDRFFLLVRNENLLSAFVV